MDSVLHFIFGFTVGFIGVIPPGLLNMTAAKISMKQSARAAIIFATGASLVVIGQVYVGVFFSKLLNENPVLLQTMERFAIAIFIVLSVFFFIKAILDSEPSYKSVDKHPARLFGQGIILSVLNIFPIPFYMGFSAFLAGKGLFKFEYPTAHLFIIGAAAGTFIMLCAYIKYVQRLGFNSRTFARKVHYILAFLTMAIALFTLFKTM